MERFRVRQLSLMTRRTIIIILGALIVVALMLASWFWLFSKGSNITNGLFGQSGSRTGTTTAQGTPTNIQSGVGSNTTSNASTGGLTSNQTINVPLTGGNTVGSGGAVSPVGSGSSVSGAGSQGIANVPGVNWLGGSGTGSTGSAGGSGGGPTSSFVPSATNQLNSGATGGQVTIYGTPPQPDNQSNLAGIFGAAGIGTALCTAGLLTTGTSALAGAAGTAALSTVAVTVNAPVQNIKNADSVQQRFLDCIARSIGRAIVNQITASVINWINGGFNGSPSFVQNYQQFFTNVADLAAGSYIQSSALSFLCSPFQLQIRIAIAQSYAYNNMYGYGLCSLSQVTQNVNNFINGNFNQGGWPALLSFTSIPTNNPYGAYAYAEIGLAGVQQQALANANKNITPGGFIGYVQTYDCTAGGTGTNNKYIYNSSFLTPPQSAAQICPSNCKCKTATPGNVIEQSLINTNNGSADMIRQLGISGSFDAILSALVTQLMTRTLQQGLSNLSGTQGYASNFLTPDQQQAQAQGNSFLTTLQAAQQLAQQYGQTEQGSISDIQNAQSQLSTLSNCWETIETSSTYSAAQHTQAAVAATSTQNSIAALEAQVAVHNNNITRANEAIVAIQNLQTQTLQITSTGDLSTVQANFDSASASGQLVSNADVTQAQQDRTTLQGQLATTNTQTAANLAQCKAVTPTQ